jgi:integrase
VRAVRQRRADGTVAVYWYDRASGARLPPPDHPDFAAALAAVRRGPAPRHQPGTLGELLADWRASPGYRATARATQISRDRYLRALDVPEWSARRITGLDMEAIRKLRAELLALRDGIARQNGPGAATVFGAHASAAFAWAVDTGRLALSPLLRMRSIEGGHIPAWTEAERQHAMATWPQHLREVVDLAYWTGLRRSDLAALRWDQHYSEPRGALIVQPGKTRRRREAAGKPPLLLPLPTHLALALRLRRAAQPEATHILLTASGKPWTPEALSRAIRAALAAEGWDTRKGLHGLRKRGAAAMAEAGVAGPTIQRARGWDTAAMVDLYTAGADQEAMARAAVKRLESAGKKRSK